MPVLGIETSCDETAAAVVGLDGDILSNVVLSQLDDHKPYGGVVPEIAARAHLVHLDGIIDEAMREADMRFSDLSAVAATAGPGLIGGLMVGSVAAKTIAAAYNKPFVAVNHLEAHALTARFTDGLAFPYLLLLVSGGHCQLQIVEGVGQYLRLGTTVDDALGEAFDKTAKLMGLGYPGGPALEARAKDGDPTVHALPRPMLGREGCHFSFSGLKTAVRHILFAPGRAPTDREIADIAASFHAAVGDVLLDRCAHAVEAFRKRHGKPPVLVIAGGVAANRILRQRMDLWGEDRGIQIVTPPAELCTDNAAMVAWAGAERFKLGLTDPLDFKARPRWPLDPDAPPAAYAGVKA